MAEFRATGASGCVSFNIRFGPHMWHAVLFHWTPEATRVVAGGIAPAGLGTVNELRTAVLSGALRGAGRYW